MGGKEKVCEDGMEMGGGRVKGNKENGRKEKKRREGGRSHYCGRRPGRMALTSPDNDTVNVLGEATARVGHI